VKNAKNEKIFLNIQCIYYIKLLSKDVILYKYINSVILLYIIGNDYNWYYIIK